MQPFLCDTYHLSLSPVRILFHVFTNDKKTKNGDPIQSALPVFLSNLAETHKKPKDIFINLINKQMNIFLIELIMDEQHQNQKINSQPQALQTFRLYCSPYGYWQR